MSNICILGAGSWGTAQAILLHTNGHKVVIWGTDEDPLEEIITTRENKRFLPGVRIPEPVHFTRDLAEAARQAEIVVMAVPSQAVREVSGLFKPHLRDHMYLVNTAKGLELATGMRLSQVIESTLGSEVLKRYAVLTGPSHAEEVAREMPTVLTVASYSRETAFLIQDTYMSPVMRVYTNPDVPGVELGGALKNVVALATGITYGLGYGDNTVAALITRGLREMTRMGMALGGDRRTFNGLSGLGDLVVTCCSRHSRNRRAGELIGQGHSLEDTLKTVGMVVEGAHTCRVLHFMALNMGVDMPITRACYNILYENKPPDQEVAELMRRQKKHEIEEIVNDNGNW